VALLLANLFDLLPLRLSRVNASRVVSASVQQDDGLGRSVLKTDRAVNYVQTQENRSDH
jgi:hypothetical protein